jgi:hypothetical protein
LNELVEVRTETERIRRLFHIELPAKRIKRYVKTIHQLIDMRIRLSRIWHNFETSKLAFTKSDEIKSHLNKMKTYLSDLTNEYDPKKIEAIKDSKSTTDAEFLNNLLCFNDFIVRQKSDTRYAREFLNEYHQALRKIRFDILSGKPPEDFPDEIPENDLPNDTARGSNNTEN